ncbi:copper-binding protein [Antarcticirhabdus aurantiaca]|uniref:Copper-binding protein n=1 Tax=Antarcticirhabdus aurantiaca TaxID=2606717 RepID=A0ACD4NWZ4_9HYPH|nr:copper-binding protein [Antarcticirhabdus aurantiaca]WAJ31233.1 copper-binding protein [Jeongeuplla avenae]
MKKYAAALVAALSLAAVAAPAAAAEFTKGTVTKVDTKQKKVTVDHEPLANLDMPAMKMVFNVADEAMLSEVSAGKSIQFVAERVKGKLTIVDIK